MDELVRFTALGFGAGGLYAVAAIGLVLIHRSSGVVNFAQGAIGMVGAYVYFEAHVQHTVAWPLAMLLGFGGSAIVGAGFNQLVMYRLRSAAALTKTVATIALLVTLQGIALLRYGPFPKLIPSVLPNGATTILGTSVGQDRLAILAIALVLTAVLWWIYRSTTFGVATSAVAENPRAAAALGVSPNGIAAANWAIGSALGAFASILLAPITGLEPTSASFLVIPVLAAAVIGKFKSFPMTTAAAIVIGVTQSLVISPKLVANHWHQPGLPTAVPFVLVAIVLIARGSSTMAKDESVGRMPAVGSGRIAPGLIAVGVLVSLACIWLLFPTDWVVAFQIQIMVAVLLMSFVVVTGYGGQISLAQGAIGGVGALMCGWLNVSQGWPLELAAVAGLAVSIPISFLLGSAGIRTRGVNLAIVTLGFAIAVGPAVFSNPRYTGGVDGGFESDGVKIFGVDLDPINSPERYATFALVILVIVGLAIANLRRGRAGRRLIAVRTNERAAAALGVSVVQAKMYAFILGGLIATLGAMLIVYRYPVLSFGGFGGIGSVFLLQESVIGGVGVLGGPLAGSGFQPGTLGQKVLGAVVPGDPAVVLVVIGGIGLLIMLSFAPDGLAELQRRRSAVWLEPLRRRIRRDRPDTPSDIEPAAPREPVTPKTLRISGLTVRFGGTVALDGLDLEVRAGEVVGLIGPNGAGKSTAIEAITGFVKPASGSVELDGVDLTTWSRERRARAGLGRSFQSLELFDDLTARENVLAACDDHRVTPYLTDLVAPGKGQLTADAGTVVDDFQLGDQLDTKVAELSYAVRRSLAVARTVAGGGSILLLDEPASGLDSHQAIRLGETIRRLADERGVGILLVEHNVDMVLSTCDRVYALDFGKLIAHGSPAEVRANANVIDAYLGTTRFRDDTTN